MPVTKTIKPAAVVPKTKTVERTKAMKSKPLIEPETQPKVLTPRRTRASSFPRCPHADRCARTRSGVSTTRCERRSRSTSRPTGSRPKANPTCQKTTGSSKSEAKDWQAEKSPFTAQRGEQRAAHPKAQCTAQSHKAFTVIPPDPKKRKEIQKKAEAELAALEELRLSRAMAYVSINPSSVDDID
ncbi:uncharacterized protein zgc:194621 [Lampris incognitus]|uniref:uncharacterized protein zgc:194621 n=1 Tax=Lampris incognitus TaxID=2546036 RepID=UPI0024B61D38|nr:uncharacterized protein zgc:194621 [Lampris incognitus]